MNGEAVILDTTDAFDGTQDPNRSEMFLVKEFESKGEPLYFKYESTNPRQSDTIHEQDHPWLEQVTACPPLISGDDEYDALLVTDSGREVNVDDGFILDFHGKPVRTVSIEPNGDIINESRARAREQTTGRRLPRYVEWGFRLVKATKTDGPAQRFQLMETEKVRRDKAEGQMASRIGEAFTTAIEKMGNMVPGQTNINSGPSSADELLEMFDKFAADPVRATAMKEQLLAELETKTATNEE